MININELIEAEMMLDTIRQQQEIVERNTKITKNIKYETTQKRRKQLNTIFWLFVFALYASAVAYLFFFQRSFILYLIGESETVFSQLAFVCVMCGFPMVIISLVSYTLIMGKFFNRREKKRPFTPEEQELHDSCREAIAKARSVIEGMSEQLKLSSIPKKYLRVHILRWMIDAVRSQRADTNKELYNLYEQFAAEERRHKEQMNAIDNITIHNEYNYWG